MTINETGGVSSSLQAQSSANIQTASERISSGKQINSAADDAAGLAIANRLTSQVNEFSQSIRNANDGVSFLQTAEGGLSSATDGLQRIRELALQASNGILNSKDREAINLEAQAIKSEIFNTFENLQFNNQKIFDGDASKAVQIGEDSQIKIGQQSQVSLFEGFDLQSLDLSTAQSASSALSVVDQAQGAIVGSRANIGASINRLDSSINTLLNAQASSTEARSRIEDADIAQEITSLTANKIKQEITIALQAQQNNDATQVLRLLGQ